MSQTYAPLQIYNLFKSCMIVFLLQALASIFMVPFTTLDPIVRILILFLNVLISVPLGWLLYKRRYHMVFTYDKSGFTLKKGNGKENSYKWNEYSRISLVRGEEGDFSIRLYKNADFFDLPTSKLKLNPFDFRSEVMRLVSASKSRK